MTALQLQAAIDCDILAIERAPAGEPRWVTATRGTVTVRWHFMLVDGDEHDESYRYAVLTLRAQLEREEALAAKETNRGQICDRCTYLVANTCSCHGTPTLRQDTCSDWHLAMGLNPDVMLAECTSAESPRG